MSKSGYQNIFENWEVYLVVNEIKKFKIINPCLKREDNEDLLQICLIGWHYKRKYFKRNLKASKKTYMHRVIKNILIDIVRKNVAEKRKINYLAESFDAFFEKENKNLNIAGIPEINKHSNNYNFSNELRVDISKIIEVLTKRQRLIINIYFYSGYTAKETSKILKIARSTLYEEIKKIKATFSLFKMDKYLFN